MSLAPVLTCRTLFISDVHLAAPGSKSCELARLLRRIRCEKIVLNGDFYDLWALDRNASLLKKHAILLRVIEKKRKNEHCEIVYLRGNHDDLFKHLTPLLLPEITILNEYIHECLNGKKYIVVHGDCFDGVIAQIRGLAMLGAFAYESLMLINRYYNRWLTHRNKPEVSFSKAIKRKVKSILSSDEKFDKQVKLLVREHACNGIICGHIHTPSEKRMGTIHYMNSGDWVESMSFIYEDFDGKLHLDYYSHYKDTLKTKHSLLT